MFRQFEARINILGLPEVCITENTHPVQMQSVGETITIIVDNFFIHKL